MADKNDDLTFRPLGKRSPEHAERPGKKKAIDKCARISQACELCREKRARCNGERPTCQRCAKIGIECHYGLTKHDRRRREVEDLKLRIEEYEGLLKGQAPALNPKAQQMFRTQRHTASRLDMLARSDHDPPAAIYSDIGAARLHSRSLTDLFDLGQSSFPISEPIRSSTPSRPILPRGPYVGSPYQPAAYSASDQFTPHHRRLSSVPSLHNSSSSTDLAAEWHRDFIYSTRESTMPPREITIRAIKSFVEYSAMLFEFFDRDEMDQIFQTVYETQPSPERAAAVCQLCIAAAVGCQYDCDEFPDGTGKSYLTVAKLYVEEVVESHPLSAMRVMALLALYFSFEKRVSSLVYVDSGLAIARVQMVDVMIPTAVTMKWKRTWGSLVFLSCWISATLGHYPDQIRHHFHASMLNFGTSSISAGAVVQLEMCKLALLTGGILRDVYHAPDVDTNVVNVYKAELESWVVNLPQYMHIDSLLTNGSSGTSIRPIILAHLLYLTAKMLMFRRILFEIATKPKSLIFNITMEDVKNHLDECLWSSKQVSRILNIGMLNSAVLRKCWMFIHATYCASNILLYFAANKFLQNSDSESIAEDLTASGQCISTLEYCAAADESALQLLKTVKPLHVALNNAYLVANIAVPQDVLPIASLVKEYLEVPRPNFHVGDDLVQMQQSVVSVIETLMQRTHSQSWPTSSAPSSLSSYPDPEADIPLTYQIADDSAYQTAQESISPAEKLESYFWDDNLVADFSPFFDDGAPRLCLDNSGSKNHDLDQDGAQGALGMKQAGDGYNHCT